MVSEDKLSGRREFLKHSAFAGGGFSLFGHGTLSIDRKTKIDVLRTKDGVAKRKKVPARWYRHLQQARSKHRKLRTAHSDKPWFTNSYLTQDENQTAGFHRRKIVVEHDLDQLAANSQSDDSHPLPSELNGIAVETADPKERTETGCRNVGEYKNLPGGVSIKGDNIPGSTCCRAEMGGQAYELTAYHVTGCNPNASFEQGGNNLGSLAEGDQDEDWGLINVTNSNYSLTEKVKEPDGERKPIQGWVTRNGVDTYKEEDRYIYQLGRETGQSMGKIQNIDASFASSCAHNGGHNKAIELGNDGAPGDSGGPFYILEDSVDVWMMGITQYNYGYVTGFGCSGAEKQDKTGGIPIWYIANNHGISVP
ncbi:chymotrypsin family serine protease [Halorussus halophilus]|uniref:hypothetical protein n=1 Tax=Halorussus halophilus TaxID=2650975 RepID=UPI0013015C60|nr:hypothetical protein [Halorussus halophilus]